MHYILCQNLEKCQPEKKPRFYEIIKIKARKPSWDAKSQDLVKKPSAGHTEENGPRSYLIEICKERIRNKML